MPPEDAKKVDRMKDWRRLFAMRLADSAGVMRRAVVMRTPTAWMPDMMTKASRRSRTSLTMLSLRPMDRA